MSYSLMLYIAVPAFVANVLPVLVARWHVLPRLATAVHEPFFGAHKTWRGFFVGTIGGGLAAFTQWLFFAPHLESGLFALMFGCAGGFGALSGDLLKSFIKRRMGVAPGRPFIPLDYIDYMLGFLLFTMPFYDWDLNKALFLIGTAFVINPLSNLLGYALGLKNTYW